MSPRFGQECHSQAWKLVQQFMDSSCQVFAGNPSHAESTLMPRVMQWAQQCLEDLPGTGDDSQGVVVWLNTPTAGIIAAAKWDFFLTFLSNLLNHYRKNSVAIVVHPNRAAQTSAAASRSKLEHAKDC